MSIPQADRWYLRNGDPGYPGYPDEIDLIQVEPFRCQKPDTTWPVADRLRLQDAAGDWLETDEGRSAALAHVEAADDRAREYASELRRDA